MQKKWCFWTRWCQKYKKSLLCCLAQWPNQYKSDTFLHSRPVPAWGCWRLRRCCSRSSLQHRSWILHGFFGNQHFEELATSLLQLVTLNRYTICCADDLHFMEQRTLFSSLNRAQTFRFNAWGSFSRDSGALTNRPVWTQPFSKTWAEHSQAS